MNWLSRSFALIFLLLTMLAGSALGQSKSELEKRRNALIKEIETTNALLEKTRDTKQKSEQELIILGRQIRSREKLIQNIQKEIDLLEVQIQDTREIITSLENDLTRLKEEYANLVYFGFKNLNSQNQMGFIFSAENFNEAFRRMKFLRMYGEYRARQAKLIEDTRTDLDNKLADLELKKEEKQQLMAVEEQQRDKLQSEVATKQKILGKLSQEEKEIAQKLNEKRQITAQLDEQIKEIIKRELELAKKREKEAAEAGKLPSPELAALSANFAGNQGKLPWPVPTGIITSTFGEHPHPVLKNIQTRNNGIDIKTTKDAKVLSIFDGEVVNVIFNPGFQKAVIVKHGDYFSVYSNLKEVAVKTGDKVKIKQEIGTVYTDPKENKTEVHLEIWKGTQKLNPELWLFK